MPRFFVAMVLCALAGPAGAALKTVTLSVPTMDCPVCPVTIGKALKRVPGVAHAEVDFARREATVTFDDAKAGLDDLTRATKNAGYPSKAIAKAP